jgi:hypothetical protein
LGLDPELAMEVGKRQAKENCVKFLATTCLNQYARYLASRGSIAVSAIKDFDERTTAYAKKIQDEEALKKAPSSSKKSAKGGSSSSSGGSGGKKDDDQKTRVTTEQGFHDLEKGERVGKGLKPDGYHRVSSFGCNDPKTFNKFNITGRDGNPYTLYQRSAEVNGKKGIFEYIVNNKGEITHQLFKRNGIVNGVPN